MNIAPRVMAAVAFVVTFAAGVGATRAFDAWSRRNGAPVTGGAWADAERELGLSATQREAVGQIFAKYQPSTDAVLTSLIPALSAVSDSMQREIEAVLDSAQRERLRALQRPPLYVIRRKTLEGSRVDTVPPRKNR